ncbi:hypothetical protein ACFSTC_55965 [Nonomuraea ferruginea]
MGGDQAAALLAGPDAARRRAAHPLPGADQLSPLPGVPGDGGRDAGPGRRQRPAQRRRPPGRSTPTTCGRPSRPTSAPPAPRTRSGWRRRPPAS